MGKQQDRSSTPPADGPPPLGRHNGVEPNAPWSTQATPTTAGMPSPSRRGADPGTAAHLVGAAGYPADPRPPSGSLLNGGAGEHRPAPWQRVHDLPRDTCAVVAATPPARPARAQAVTTDRGGSAARPRAAVRAARAAPREVFSLRHARPQRCRACPSKCAAAGRLRRLQGDRRHE